MSILPDSPHSKALAQLYPKTMDAEQNAVSVVLDEAMSSIDDAYQEQLPSTATDASLTKWEGIYELTGDGTTEERWAAVKAAWAAQPGIAARNYVALAAAMGYAVEIPDPPMMFRAGVTPVGRPVYDADEQYTWSVRVCDASESGAADLMAAFEDQKIPFTVIRWEWLFETDEAGEPEIDEAGELQLDEEEE
ncbi:MAG: putative phage tail protein [Sphaerochaetaceae bacterium]